MMRRFIQLLSIYISCVLHCRTTFWDNETTFLKGMVEYRFISQLPPTYVEEYFY